MSLADEDRIALARAAERLEEVARALEDPDAPPEEVRRLAERALVLSAEIGERLPRVLRRAEEAAESGG
jgi:hypothetical protein